MRRRQPSLVSALLSMRRAPLIGVLLMLTVLVQSAAESADDGAPDDFAQRWAACREHVKAHRWESAQRAYAELLAGHEGDLRVFANLGAIEDDLKLCAFRAGRRPPSGKDLFGAEVVKFTEGARTVELVYPVAGAGTRWIPAGDLSFLELRFENDVEITVPAEGKASLPIEVRAILCWSVERTGGYMVVSPYDDGDRLGSDGVIYRYDGPAPVPLSRLHCPYKKSTRSIRIARKGKILRCVIEGEGGDRNYTEDATYAGGYVGLRVKFPFAGLDSTSVRIRGKLDEAFYKQELAGFDDRAYRAWEAEAYRREEVLPAWALEPRKRVTSDEVAVVAPSDCPAEVREALRPMIERLDRGEVVAFERPPGPLPEATARYVDALDALVRGSWLEASGHLTALIEFEPAFARALVLRALSRYALRDVEGARIDLATASEHASRVPLYHLLLTRLAVLDGDLEGAKSALDAAVRIGIDAEPLEELGRIVHRAIRGPQWTRSFRFTSPHFDVRSDHSQQMCIDVAERLEASLKSYEVHFRASRERKLSARVLVFSNRQTFVDYGGELALDNRHAAGAYSPTLRELTVWFPIDRSDFEDTLQHEAFHQYVHNFVEDLPLWFNEGFAEYFGRATYAKGKLVVGTPAPRTAEEMRAAWATFLPLREFLALSREAFMARGRLSYSQSWALVTALRESTDPELAKALPRFFDAIVAGASAETAREAVIDPLVPRIEVAFDEYLARTFSLPRVPR